MMTRRFTRWLFAGIAAIATIVLLLAATQVPAIGAGGLLHPARHRLTAPRPPTCADVTFAGEGLALSGWRCDASTPRRGTIVYLHGVADNRGSARGVIERFGARGFDVVAYDSRAHGESPGEACTYGFYEKKDLYRVLDGVPAGPIVLIGTSLGAAVALQEAAGDPRVSAVIAAETFSDLRTVASERAPFFFSRRIIARAFSVAEQQARFRVDEVSPEMATRSIAVPVLLIHGAADVDTPPEHSRRVLAALRGPSRFILVPGAGHNGSLTPDTWIQVERWLDEVVPAPQVATAAGNAQPACGEKFTTPKRLIKTGHNASAEFATLFETGKYELGYCVTSVEVDEHGAVAAVRVVRPRRRDPRVDAIIERAILSSRFTPARACGQPVPFTTSVGMFHCPVPIDGPPN